MKRGTNPILGHKGYSPLFHAPSQAKALRAAIPGPSFCTSTTIGANPQNGGAKASPSPARAPASEHSFSTSAPRFCLTSGADFRLLGPPSVGIGAVLRKDDDQVHAAAHHGPGLQHGPGVLKKVLQTPERLEIKGARFYFIFFGGLI